MIMASSIPVSPFMTVHSGAVSFEAQEIILFEPPLMPFSQARYFVLVEHPEETPFLWLQSLDEPALALVVAPYTTVTEQPPPLIDDDLRAALGLRDTEEPEVYVIICVGATLQATTMNLLAPIYLARRAQRARQVILEGDLSLAQTPLFRSSEIPNTAAPGREIHAGADASNQ